MALFEQGLLIVQDALEYQELDVSTSVMGLSPSTPNHRIRRCLIHNKGDIIRWVAVNGVDPTADFGAWLDADDILVYDGDPAAITFILDASATGTSTLYVHYFGA